MLGRFVLICCEKCNALFVKNLSLLNVFNKMYLTNFVSYKTIHL